MYFIIYTWHWPKQRLEYIVKYILTNHLNFLNSCLLDYMFWILFYFTMFMADLEAEITS